ncbi:sodium:proton antiporter [Oscillibacter sp. MSJ-2]|uniref:Sodium:proton antiporter n=1 Tax=Dysosmobacter acutus TaxID=2841504 RepID=A0ABS6F7I8_9FIRM|nr:monovalent cation/H+ antiporter complex subunit F [Dysosmobacter acutus]MBU5626243.1 sodium:proton antiporter [Dysosmobacter acutus]
MMRHYILLGSTVAFTLLILAALIRSILGPRFTDRIVAVNVLNTMVVAVISILSVWLGEDYLVDVALVYALLSFLTVVVLSRLVLARRRRSGVKFHSKEGKL